MLKHSSRIPHVRTNLVLVALLVFLIPNYSLAIEEPGPVRQVELKVDEKDAEQKPLHQLTLDELFSKLKQVSEARKAIPIEKAIWRRWISSGSETVDLLMAWSAQAMKKKDWSTALDLLDQVVVLVPHYAEGWNRRATVHFLRSDYSRSMHDIEQVLKLEHRHFGALAGLGAILQKMDNHKQALVIWKKVLDLYPANKNAQKTVEALAEKVSGQGI